MVIEAEKSEAHEVENIFMAMMLILSSKLDWPKMSSTCWNCLEVVTGRAVGRNQALGPM